MSNPPNIGDPKINARVTITPKTIPTMIKRLFIIKNLRKMDKNELKYEWIWNNP